MRYDTALTLGAPCKYRPLATDRKTSVSNYQIYTA